jgi:hypothetical protein
MRTPGTARSAVEPLQEDPFAATVQGTPKPLACLRKDAAMICRASPRLSEAGANSAEASAAARASSPAA